jgi:hypothetical protein
MTISSFTGVACEEEYGLPRLEDQLEADLATLETQYLLLYIDRMSRL